MKLKRPTQFHPVFESLWRELREGRGVKLRLARNSAVNMKNEWLAWRKSLEAYSQDSREDPATRAMWGEMREETQGIKLGFRDSSGKVLNIRQVKPGEDVFLQFYHRARFTAGDEAMAGLSREAGAEPQSLASQLWGGAEVEEALKRRGKGKGA